LKIKNFFLHYGGTISHKWLVMMFLLRFCRKLLWRAIVHDFSKMRWSEAKHFIRVIHKLKTSTYGSDEYKELLVSIQPALILHYQRNDHHPENHHSMGLMSFYGMDMINLTEMLADWYAATMRHADGDIFKSIRGNQDRFNYPDEIREIFSNSIKNGDFTWKRR